MIGTFLESQGIFCYGELSVNDLSVWDQAKFEKMEQKIGKAESAVIFLIPYFAGQKTTNLSIYAQPRDYHLYMRLLSQKLEAYLREKESPLRFCGFTDSSPIREREAALRAGLGVLGENGLILNPRYGSYCFIGEFFLNRAISPQKALAEEKCSGCAACREACPTGAVSDPERGRCLSLISQKKERTSEEESLLEKASCKWGCDLCQSACPWNRDPEKTPIDFFSREQISHLTKEVIESPKEVFRARAFSWRGREILRKNLKR